MVKYWQRLGKSLLLPIAVLSVCGIVTGLGYALCPAAGSGEISGPLALVGFFLVRAGGALLDQMAWLFAVGVAAGMAREQDSAAALSGLVSWLVITYLLRPETVTVLWPALADNPTSMLAFNSIENAFTGILAGVIGAVCYNRFHSMRLPESVSFFSGKGSVLIITGLFSTIVAVMLLFVWPAVFGLLAGLGRAMAGLGTAGAGLYAFLNRLLVPSGLHHALTQAFWPAAGTGDLTHFLAGNVSGANGAAWSFGLYLSGFFPCTMFGIPGAALAMMHTAKPSQKKMVVGMMTMAALCALLCGVTEPFVLSFLFFAPQLYVIYALLHGLFTILTVLLVFRAGFAFSAGATDFLAARTWLIIPLGLVAFVVFYSIFRIAIVKWNLPTPGRDRSAPVRATGQNHPAVAAAGDYGTVAANLLEGIGGKGNIASLDHCVTRLRLEVRDYTLVQEEKIKASPGVLGVLRPGKTTVQIIIGPKVQLVADEMRKLL